MSGGCVRPRGEGRELRWELPRGPDGKRHTKTLAWSGTKASAEKELRRLMPQLDERTHADAGGLTVARWIDRWLDLIETEVSPRTRERYQELCAGFIAPRLGAVALDRLDANAIQGMLTELATTGRLDGKPGGLSATTRKHIHRCLSAALVRSVELGVLGRNPCDRLRKRLPKAEWRELAVLDAQQTAKVLAAIKGRRIYWPALLAVTTAARRSGGAGAAVAQCRSRAQPGHNIGVDRVDPAGPRFKPPQNGRARTVALPDFAVAELRRHRVEQAQELLPLD
jgi:hypothetical protein